MSDFDPEKEDFGLGWMHVLPQHYPHSHAVIRGNRKALEALRQAIDDALANKVAVANVFANDGEGYAIMVEEVNVLDALGAPFYLDYYNSKRDW